MERLTDRYWRNFDPWECCGQDNYCQRGCHDEGGCANGCIVPKLYVRLAKYEDTGLEPEEVKSLDWERRREEERTLAAMWGYGIDPDRLTDIIDAEKEGRLLVLPCKVGSKIYILRGDVRNGYETVKETHVEEVPFGLGCLDKQMKLYPFYFLTREEAEAKLKEEME